MSSRYNYIHALILLLFFPVEIQSNFDLFYERDCIEGKTLTDNVVQTFSDFPNVNPAICFSKCAHDCRCESFQFQQSSGGNSVCELNGYPFNLSGSLIKKNGFVFCNMTKEIPINKGCHCEQGCCNSLSNPCKAGGGQCIIGCNTRPRYMCICKDGKIGTKCTPRPNSCAEVLKLDPFAKTGYHTIYLSSSKYTMTKVYCEFFYQKAWTLVEAFERSHDAPFNFPFFIDKPVASANDVRMLSEYRMSLQWMESVKNHSRFWRATCNYKHNVYLDKIDYVETSFQNIDLLSNKLSPDCLKVDYININRNQCTQCTTWFSQASNQGPHFTPKYGEKVGCMFRGPVDQPINANVFGNYTTAYSQFRCTLASDSTTAFWFGDTV